MQFKTINNILFTIAHSNRILLKSSHFIIRYNWMISHLFCIGTKHWPWMWTAGKSNINRIAIDWTAFLLRRDNCSTVQRENKIQPRVSGYNGGGFYRTQMFLYFDRCIVLGRKRITTCMKAPRFSRRAWSAACSTGAITHRWGWCFFPVMVTVR